MKIAFKKIVFKAVSDTGIESWIYRIDKDEFLLTRFKSKAMSFDYGEADNVLRELRRIQAGYDFFSFEAVMHPQIEIPYPAKEHKE